VSVLSLVCGSARQEASVGVEHAAPIGQHGRRTILSYTASGGPHARKNMRVHMPH
jgi:hypothetical protein